MERVEIEKSSHRIRFGFPAAPRSGEVVVRATALTGAYGDTSVCRQPSSRSGGGTDRADRPNAGKSTLKP
jgi:hypothetical protein